MAPRGSAPPSEGRRTIRAAPGKTEGMTETRGTARAPGHAELPATSFAEEMANSLTGGLGLLASILGAALLLSLALQGGDGRGLASAAVYGGSLIFLYIATTLYHAEEDPAPKSGLRLLDHVAVYLLIAGTYTPVAVVGLGGRLGWTLLGLVWLCAVAGILFKAFRRFRHPAISVATYLAMGWLVVVAAKPITAALPLRAVVLLVAGGLAYTVGTIFFGLKKLRFHHAVWHLFVIAGSTCHYAAIALDVLGPA